MDRARKLLGIALVTALAMPASSCCPPSMIQINAQLVNGDCKMTIDYESTALGLYVAGLDARFPTGNVRFPGRIYWGLDTTTFPNAIQPPVTYGSSDTPNSVDTNPSGNGMDTIDMFAPTPEGSPNHMYPFPLVAPKGQHSMIDDPRTPSGAVVAPGADLTNPDDPGIPMELLSEGFSQCVEPQGANCPRVFQVAVVTLAGTIQVPITNFTCTPELQIYGGELLPHRG